MVATGQRRGDKKILKLDLHETMAAPGVVERGQYLVSELDLRVSSVSGDLDL